MPAPVLCILCERNIACLGLGFASASVSFPHPPHLLLSLLFLRSALPDHGSHASSYPGSYPPRPMVRENRSYLCCHIAQFVKVKKNNNPIEEYPSWFQKTLSVDFRVISPVGLSVMLPFQQHQYWTDAIVCLGPKLVTLWSAMRLEVTWQNRRHDNSDNSMIIAPMSLC